MTLGRTIRCLALSLCAAGLLAGCSEPESREEEQILARLDGESLSLAEVERRAGWRLHRARLDEYLVLEREIDRWIEERLLEKAALERGVEVDVLTRELAASLPSVSDADVDRYLAEHPEDASIDGARPRIRHYLDETRRIERRLAFAAALREESEVEILLAPPRRPRIELDLRDAPARGPEGAAVTIVHFADLSRADSARAARDLARAAAAQPDRVRTVHRSLPVVRDELGLLTAQLAAATPDPDRFWDLHDRIIAGGGVRDRIELEAHATAAGLGDLIPGLAGHADSLRRVREDLARAHEAGVRRAPTFFVNGRYLSGLDGFEALSALIEDELSE